jgi:ABC-type Fe3+ transport system permease subunit
MTADWSPLWLGFRAAALSAAIALALGPCLAYYLRERASASLAWLPLSVSPALLIAYCLLAGDFRWTIAALVASLFSVPYLVRVSAVAFDSLPPQYFNAARGLGASEWLVFRRIAWPLTFRKIVAAAAFVLASVATDASVLLILVQALRTRGLRAGPQLQAAPLIAVGAFSLAIHYLAIRWDRGPVSS